MIIHLPKIGPVQFRDDLSPEEFQSQLGALTQKYGVKLPKPDVGIGTLAKRGFQRGMGQLGIAAGDVLPAMGASALGFDDYAKQQMGDAAVSSAQLEDQYPTQFKSYKEVESLGDAAGFASETLGELGPTALGVVTPGVGAGVVGARVAANQALKQGLKGVAAQQATQQGAKRAMYGGVYFGSIAQNAPEVFQNIYQETGKFEPGLAALTGGISSVLDTIVPGNVLSQLGNFGKQKLIAEVAKQSGAAPKVWRSIAEGAAKTAGIEGLTESAQESLSAAAEQIAGSNKDILGPENIQRYKEAFVKGAIGGAAFGTVGGAANYANQSRAVKEAQATDVANLNNVKEQLDQVPAGDPRRQPMQAQYDALKSQIVTKYGADRVPQGMEPLTPTTQAAPEDLGTTTEQPVQDTATAQPTMMPEQPGIVPTPQPTPSSPYVATPEFIKGLGLQKNHGFAKFIAGMDLGDVENLRKVLQAVEDNKITGSATQEKAFNKLMSVLPPETVAKAKEQVSGQGIAPVTPQPDLTPLKPEEVQQYAQLVQDAEGSKLNSPDNWTEADERMLNAAKTRLEAAQAPPTTAPEIPPTQEPAAPLEGFKTANGTQYSVGEGGRTVRNNDEPHPTYYVDKQSRDAISGIIKTKAGQATVNLGYDSQGSFVPVRALEDVPPGAEPAVGVVDKTTNEPIRVFPAEVAPATGLYPVAKLHRPQGSPSTYISQHPISEVGDVVPKRAAQPKAATGIPATEQAPLDQLIADLKTSKFKPTDVEAKAASQYFKKEKIGNALKNIAYEASQESADSRVGRRGRLAEKWVRKNLPPLIVQKLDKHIATENATTAKLKDYKESEGIRERYPKPEVGEAKTATTTAKVIEESNPSDFYDTRTPEDLRTYVQKDDPRDYYADNKVLGTPLHSEVVTHLKANELTQALQKVAARSKSVVGTIAGTLGKNVGNVKVKYGEKSKYDPTTNIITLKDGATMYDLLHEASHAALSHTIDKPSHPVTKQLQAIFNEVQGKIDPVYGTQNLQEFVAEAWSNGEFRKQLRETRTRAENLSLWDRLVNMLRRLLGLPQKKIPNTIDAIDRILQDIASPPPDVREGDSLYAQSINDPNIGQKIFSGIDKVVQGAPLMNAERATTFWASLEKLSTKGKELAYKTLNLSALGEVSQKVFGKLGVDFSNVVNSMSGYQENMQEAVYPIHRRLQVFAQSPRYQAWSTLVHQSTLADVNPAAPASKYAKDSEKLAKHKELSTQYNKLTAEEKKLYNDLFASYKTLNSEMMKSLEANTLASIPDQEAARSAYKKILAELADIHIDHYAPLFRRGIYRMDYKLNGEVHKPFYLTQVERDAAKKKLEAQGATDFDLYVNAEQEISRNPPDGTVIANVINILKDVGAATEAVERVAQMVAKALPETSMLKRRMKREGIGGYIDDAALSFDNVTSGTIHQLSRLKYASDMQRLTMAMAEKVNTIRGPDQEKARLLLKEFESRREFINNPNISSWAQLASTGSFFYFLAANVSSAVVNMAQVPLIVLPQLAGAYGYRNAFKMLWGAMDMYGHSGFKRNVKDLAGNTESSNAMWSIENLVNSGKADKYRNLVTKLKDYGFLQTSTARDAVISADQPNSAYGGTTRLHYLTNLVGTFMFHHAERFNREITAVAAFDLEMKKLENNHVLTSKEKEDQAITKAVHAVEYMHGAGHTLTGPSIGHSDLGKVLMVFKRFAFSMYYMLFDTAMRSLPVKGATGEKLEGIRMARRQLAGIYGMSAIFAGAKGLPMYWVAETAYNALKEDDEDDFDAVMRQFLGDMAYKGPVNYFTNLSIADRVGWEDLIFREAKKDKADASALSSYLEGMLGAPYAIINNMFRAKDLVDQGHYARAVEAALPTSMGNVFKGARFATEGVNTLRGDPIMGEVNPYNAVAQIFGFSPADLSLQYKTNEYRKQTVSKLMGSRDKLMRNYYLAYRMGDFERENDLKEELFKLGDKHPELGIDEDYLKRSIRSRDAISADMINGITIPKKFKESMSEVFSDIK